MKLFELCAAAREEKWDAVDAALENPANLEAEIVDWALGQGLFYDDENLRDLAASVIEATGRGAEVAEKLRALGENDPSDAVRVHALGALVAAGIFDDEIRAGLENLIENPDSDIADFARAALKKAGEIS